MKMRKQWTVFITGALIDDDGVNPSVKRPQVGIAKVMKVARMFLLTRSLYAKFMAVKRVTSYGCDITGPPHKGVLQDA